MEWFFCYGVGLLNVLVVSVCLLEVDCIVFEINNMDVNKVVYILEENINMTCSEPNIRNPQFEILHGSSLVEETPNLKFTIMAQSMTLTITQVQLMDEGEYTCHVRGMNSTDNVATASLTLNVQKGGAHCLYNDSSLDWNEGETKNLSCYYPASFSDQFQWQVLDSSSSSFPLMSSSLYTDNVHKRRILFASIGPLKSSDNGNIYQCLHSTVYPADVAALCMFGPIFVNPIVAATPKIEGSMNPSSTRSQSRTKSTVSNKGLATNFQSTPKLMKGATSKVKSSPVTSREPSTSSSVTSREPSTSSSVTSREPLTSSSVTLQEPSTSSSINITTTAEEPGPISMLVLLIIAVVCVVIIVSCMICLIVICKCRGKNNEKEKDSEMMTNQVYDPFDGYMKPDANVLSTEKTTYPMAGSGDVVTETPLDARNQVGDEYDKLDHNKEKLHNHRTRPLAATRSSLLQNDSEYDKLDHSKERFHGHIKPPMSAARGSLVEKKLSDEKNDVKYDTVANGAGKVKGHEKPSNDAKFQKADAVYDKVNTNGLGRKQGKTGTKIGDSEKANGNLDIQELYAKIDKTKSLERSKAKQERLDDAVLY